MQNAAKNKGFAI